MENDLRWLIGDLGQAIAYKRWDEVRELYYRYKDELPRITTYKDIIRPEDELEPEFQTIKKHRQLHHFVTAEHTEDETKRTLGILFSSAYPYIMNWYDE